MNMKIYEYEYEDFICHEPILAHKFIHTKLPKFYK